MAVCQRSRTSQPGERLTPVLQATAVTFSDGIGKKERKRPSPAQRSSRPLAGAGEVFANMSLKIVNTIEDCKFNVWTLMDVTIRYVTIVLPQNVLQSTLCVIVEEPTDTVSTRRSMSSFPFKLKLPVHEPSPRLLLSDIIKSAAQENCSIESLVSGDAS